MGYFKVALSLKFVKSLVCVALICIKKVSVTVFACE